VVQEGFVFFFSPKYSSTSSSQKRRAKDFSFRRVFSRCDWDEGFRLTLPSFYCGGDLAWETFSSGRRYSINSPLFERFRAREYPSPLGRTCCVALLSAFEHRRRLLLLPFTHLPLPIHAEPSLFSSGSPLFFLDMWVPLFFFNPWEDGNCFLFIAVIKDRDI